MASLPGSHAGPLHSFLEALFVAPRGSGERKGPSDPVNGCRGP